MSKPEADPIRFDGFVLDIAARQLWRGGERVHLNPRYFDALVLLAGNPGKVLSRQQFMAEVWHDAVVGDDALSQCIAALRRALGDEAAAPRFIRTVPRRGYEFLAREADAPAPGPAVLTVGATIGGALAGTAGGLIYGIGLAYGHPLADQAAILAVMLAVNVGIGALAAFGSVGGFATGTALRPGVLGPILGAALGGMLVGWLVRWLSSEAFVLLFGLGMVPGTGAFEGLAMGAAVGAGLLLARGGTASRVLTCAAVVALAATLVVAFGGHLMAGSLHLLATEAGSAPMTFDHFGALVGEEGFGLAARLMLAAVEGALLGAGVALGVIWARFPGRVALSPKRT